MTAPTLIAELVASLAWPVTVLCVALLFRRHLTGLLQRIARIEYAGATITLQKEVSLLEKKKRLASESAPFQPKDLTVLLESLRADAERELFRIAQIEARGGAVSSRSLDDLLASLREQRTLPVELLDAVGELSAIVALANSTSGVSMESLKEILASAHQVLYQLHKNGLVVKMMYAFASHGVWHTHSDLTGPERRYFWWSAVASECPEFEYDYGVYSVAAARHNQKLIRSLGSESAAKGLIEVVSLRDYLAILRFRESELIRVLEADKSGQDFSSKANLWRWPKHWGDIGWSGIVSLGSVWSTEEALRETRAAIRRYEEKVGYAA